MSNPDTPAASQVSHPDDSGATVTTALNTAAIGPISLDYYLPLFSRFEASNRSGPSWNWAACLYTLNWLIFRRLWGLALAYVAVVLPCLLVLLALAKWLPGFYDAHEFALWVGFCGAYFLLPGVCGNPLLYVATRKRVLHALTVSSTLKGACEKLSHQAASRERFIQLVLTNMLLISSVVAVCLVFPDIGASAQRALFLDEVDKEDEAPVKASVSTSAAVTASAPASAPLTSQAQAQAQASSSASAPVLVASRPIPTAINGQVLMLSTTESPDASATQVDFAVMDAVALRYRPRRPLDVSATASAPAVTASATRGQLSAVSPQAVSLYYINVGLFANDWNARYAQAKLVDAGLVSFRQALMSSKGKLTRVRVGPFDSKAEADAAVKKIHGLKLDAVVFRQ